jgi:hypothetical protein
MLFKRMNWYKWVEYDGGIATYDRALAIVCSILAVRFDDVKRSM